jgi:acetyl esterase/lipase
MEHTDRRMMLRTGLIGLGLLGAAVVGLTACGTDGDDTAGSAGSATTVAVNTPVSVPTWTPPDAATALASDSPTPTVVSYGTNPNETLEVIQSTGDPQGTLIYVHGGGWTSGSMQQNTSTIVMAQDSQERLAEFQQLSTQAETGAAAQLTPQLKRGWDIVSINYDLATDASGEGVRGTQMMNDVDQAARYIRANATQLGLDLTKVVLSGGSAGGHLALMEALTASSGEYMAPDLPEDLKKVKVSFDAIIAMVAPTDMNTLWQVGYIAPVSEASMLGCSPSPTPAIAGMQACSQTTIDAWSPLYLTRQADEKGTRLPPAYFAYGGSDELVLYATQGRPEIEAWAAASGKDQTWYDYPPLGTHNIDNNVNGDALALFLDDVAAGDWNKLPVE